MNPRFEAINFTELSPQQELNVLPVKSNEKKSWNRWITLSVIVLTGVIAWQQLKIKRLKKQHHEEQNRSPIIKG